MTGGGLVDGLPARRGALARARRRTQRLAVSRSERDEVDIERRLVAHPGVTRANTVAVMSPAGGVGTTTCAFVLGSLLATHLKLRVIAVDAGPGHGTLARLVPEKRRTDRGTVELLGDADRLFTAAEIGPYVSRLSSGLHVLAAREEPRADQYGELLGLLSCFYEVIVLDVGAGVVPPVARLAASRADQIVLVTTPDRMTHLGRADDTVIVINRAQLDAYNGERPYRAVTIPGDGQLAATLAAGTYALGGLSATTRTAIKRLGLAVAEQLV